MKSKLFKLSKTKIGELIVGIAFGKFSKVLPVKKIKENKYVLAFEHPKPLYKLHILLVPKKTIKNLSSLKPNDFRYIENIFKIAQEIVRSKNLESKNYRIITNGGENQKVKQLHFHLISGE